MVDTVMSDAGLPRPDPRSLRPLLVGDLTRRRSPLRVPTRMRLSDCASCLGGLITSSGPSRRVDEASAPPPAGASAAPLPFSSWSDRPPFLRRSLRDTAPRPRAAGLLGPIGLGAPTVGAGVQRARWGAADSLVYSARARRTPAERTARSRLRTPHPRATARAPRPSLRRRRWAAVGGSYAEASYSPGCRRAPGRGRCRRRRGGGFLHLLRAAVWREGALACGANLVLDLRASR